MDAAAGSAGKSGASGGEIGSPSFGALLKDTIGSVMDAGKINPADAVTPVSEAGGTSFGALLKQTIGSVVDAGHKSDAQSAALAAGKANVMDVVTAVAETDVAVSTLVSVRDRVIQAYEDIMKMPI
jgi:flagellar hook-basal body complex protein FliE